MAFEDRMRGKIDVERNFRKDEIKRLDTHGYMDDGTTCRDEH